MNAKEAAELINNNGGDISKIPSSQLFDVLRALHGNFEFSGNYKKVFDFIQGDENVSSVVFEDKKSVAAINDVMDFDASSLEELDFKRDVTKLFGNNEKIEFLDEKIAEMLRGYSDEIGFQPSLADLDYIIPLAEKVDSDTFSGEEKRVFLAEMGKLKDSYLLAEGSDKWNLLFEPEVLKNIKYLDELYNSLSDDEKKISLIENIEIENNQLERASEKLEGSNQWLPSAKYRKELESFLSDETIRKLAMDPDFATNCSNAKDINEVKEIFFAKRDEVARDYVRELVFDQETYNFVKKFGDNPTKEEMTMLSNKAESIVTDFEIGDVPRGFKFNKEIALATLSENIRNSAAVSREIFKRIKIKDFYEVAKARQDRFAKAHPVIYNITRNVAIAGGIGAVTFVSAGLGTALSTAYAVQKTHIAYKALKTKYVNDPLYKNKTFKDYMKDHKFETGAFVMTGVMAAFPAMSFAKNLGVIEPDKAATGIARGTAVLALGVTNATNMFIKAKTKKEKVMAFAVAGASAAGAAVAVFTSSEYGQEVMKSVSEKLGAFFGGSKAVEGVSQGNVNAAAHQDTIPAAKVDTISGAHQDTIPAAKADTISGAKAEAEIAADQPVSDSSVVGQGNISDKDWARIKVRSVQTYGVEKIKEWSFNIDSGQVEAIPDGMSKEEFIYKLGQLQKLAPVVHKESINLMLRDLNCDGTVLTSEQITQVHESLKTIDIKGEYHGFEPTERTCNRVTGIKVDVNCDDKSVNVKQTVEYGDCNKGPKVSMVREGNPANEPKTPMTRSVPTKGTVQWTPVTEDSAEKEVTFEGRVTNTKGAMGDGNAQTSLDKMAEKGLVGEQYYGDQAPDVLNSARVEYDQYVQGMLERKEVVPFNVDKSITQGELYDKLKLEAIENKELVAAPIDKSTGTISYGNVAPENEGTVILVKKDTPLYNYVTEQQEKAKVSSNVVKQVMSAPKGRD